MKEQRRRRRADGTVEVWEYFGDIAQLVALEIPPELALKTWTRRNRVPCDDEAREAGW